ncbi:glycoside hydrolase family 2 TIM barrel-domain containing protein [Tamlana sp. 2_MG-2023]|uniref:glycoside hydrolase family 2 TIM barrel-domain containing protein n=1 Tax=unclassified Tamlana TaxID=2614803 RepID=UPI0026E1C71E|nr:MULTISPECIES: glycoside hydrolase family 2 TIM barrel-domain containing protein [unclassified Tamlana]MDO6761310.1 glycoside hydrolase family 2 TIM barrel-domain containing protein [Tamlana sp. 2_MG-2023]MDO6791793.1 glycoside hydrolase family 2 TIM barrel-domain containing protein [Tamlana sp. 1_MG-2023]
MRTTLSLICFVITLVVTKIQAQSRTVELLTNWKFSKYDAGAAFQEDFDDSDWHEVSIPHDWAVEGDFDFANDVQLTMVVQDGETKPNYRTGRSGALPYVGVGWYRTNYQVSPSDLSQKVQLLFDGAMSSSKVYINGEYVGERPFGYISFYFDISKFLKAGKNTIAVRLENYNTQSRWYPGAGLYRKVSVIKTQKTHVKTWGTFVTTPKISKKNASVQVKLELLGEGHFTIKNDIIDPNGKLVATKTTNTNISSEKTLSETFEVSKPQLWDLESPNLYTLKTSILEGDNIIDTYETRFGIRSIRFEVDGFYLNDKQIRFQGVNMHHDLGPSGAAFHRELFVRQMKKMKAMGVNAIRFSHNPPAPEALDVCDEMGLLAIDEAFDEWQIGKVTNGYSKDFDTWSKTDLTDMILRDRNHPSIIMWSIGNEILEQYQRDPNKITKYLNDIVKTLDTTRATTAGFNSANNALVSGMASTVDVAGFNYKPGVYAAIRKKYPNLKFYASETGGTVSVRNSYKFPVVYDTLHNKRGASLNTFVFPDGLPGNYESTQVPWGYPPVKEFASQEKNTSVYGEFVWTGYDYLGEPSPYHHAKSRSSYFAPVDFVGLEKDKYYLYQTQWRKDKDVLHFFPHWTWPELEVKSFPVVCYTSYDKAELFVNGKSYGIQTKKPLESLNFENSDIKVEASGGGNWDLTKAYAIVWDNVVYEPGEVKVVAYNTKGKKAAEMTRVTAGKPHHIKIEPEIESINSGEVGVYVVSMLDKNGNLCPHFNENMNIEVTGAAKFYASGNGDPTNMQNLSKPQRKFFNGQAVIYVKSTNTGNVSIKTTSGDFSAIHNSLIVK